MALYFGNKSPTPLMSVTTQLSQCPPLNIQLSALAGTLNPRAQQQQAVEITTCMHMDARDEGTCCSL